MSCLWNVLFMKCPVSEMSCLWNVLSLILLSMKCPSMKCLSMKCPIYEMAAVYEMSCLWNVLSMILLYMKCPSMNVSLWNVPMSYFFEIWKCLFIKHILPELSHYSIVWCSLKTKFLFIYRVTHKGWDFRDDCTEFILFVSFFYYCMIMQL